MIFQPLDAIPLPILFFLIVLAMLATTEWGYRFKKALHQETRENEGSMDSMIAASLALLSFLMAFMIGVGHDLIRERRNLVINEANAIGTTYLRAGYLQEQYEKKAQKLLREYTDTRLLKLKGRDLTREELVAAMAKSETIQEELWDDAEKIVSEDPSPTTGLYISALNELIDLHTERVSVGSIRIPPAVLLGLFAMTLLSMFLVGTQTKKKRNFIVQFVFILSLSVILYLVVDFDRSLEGLIQVTQQPMIDLQQQISS